MQLNDSTRRGLRTAIDVLLSGGATALIVLVLRLFKVDVSAEQVTAMILTLTPILSVIKNAMEDSSGRSLLISKQRPDPDPTEGTGAVQPTETEVFGDVVGDPLSVPLADQQVIFGHIPSGHVLLAVPPEDVEDGDEIVGFVR